MLISIHQMFKEIQVESHRVYYQREDLLLYDIVGNKINQDEEYLVKYIKMMGVNQEMNSRLIHIKIVIKNDHEFQHFKQVDL